jgi:hypothetical protein
MRFIPILMAAAMLASIDAAAKIRTYTFAELVTEADAIVVARMSGGDGSWRATVVRTLKGQATGTFAVESWADLERERARFTDGETAVLFLEGEADGRRRLFGYGDQGKWPRTTGAWPFAAAHVAPLQKVEAGVVALRSIHQLTAPDQQASRVRRLLRSRDRFEQAYALEYVEDAAPKAVKQALKADVVALRRATQDRYLRVMAESAERAANAKE